MGAPALNNYCNLHTLLYTVNIEYHTRYLAIASSREKHLLGFLIFWNDTIAAVQTGLHLNRESYAALLDRSLSPVLLASSLSYNDKEEYILKNLFLDSPHYFMKWSPFFLEKYDLITFLLSVPILKIIAWNRRNAAVSIGTHLLPNRREPDLFVNFIISFIGSSNIFNHTSHNRFPLWSLVFPIGWFSGFGWKGISLRTLGGYGTQRELNSGSSVSTSVSSNLSGPTSHFLLKKMYWWG